MIFYVVGVARKIEDSIFGNLGNLTVEIMPYRIPITKDDHYYLLGPTDFHIKWIYILELYAQKEHILK